MVRVVASKGSELRAYGIGFRVGVYGIGFRLGYKV